MVRSRTLGGIMLVAALAALWPAALIASAAVVVQDGFGDGDRDNDGYLDDPLGIYFPVVDDPTDIGVAWWRVFKNAGENHYLSVGHDLAGPAGLGEDNALFMDMWGDQPYQVASLPTPVTLTNAGDYIKLSFDVRLTAINGSYRDTFRFGLFDDAGTKPDPAADQGDPSYVVDDSGYLATVATGSDPTVRARIARGSPPTTNASLFKLTEDIFVENPSQHIINDTGPHRMSLTIMRSTSGSTLIKYELDGSLAMSGEDTSAAGGPHTTFNEIGFGAVVSTSGALINYALDNVLVETDVSAACETIPPVTVAAGPLPAGATTITVLNVDPNAELVNVYANGTTLIGTALGSPPATPATVDVTVAATVSGDVITATQVIGGVESCFPRPPGVTVNRCEDVSEVALMPGFRAGNTSITVLGVAATATEVVVYANGTTPIGSAAGNGTSTVVVTVSALVLGDNIMARQTVNDVVGCMPTTGVPVAGGMTVLVADGFGDGDRDNDGVPEGPVDDPTDVGLAWYRCRYTSDPILSVAHDAGGLGDDNALWIDSTATRTYPVASLPSEVVLDEPGEFIRLTFDIRVWGTVHNYRDMFRFGLFNDMGTKVTADQPDLLLVEYDAGYFATLTTGNPTGANERLVRNDPTGNQAALFGLSAPDEVLASATAAPHRITDNNSHTLSLTIMRSAAGTALVDLVMDGAVAMSAEDTSAAGGPLFSFNEVSIGMNGAGSAFVDYVIDNVQVIIAQACTPPSVASISPINGHQGEALTGVAIAGSTFVAGQTTVKLTRAGQPDIVATNVAVSDAANLTCDLDLTGAVEGLRNVVVTTPCSPGTLANGFEVKPACNTPPQDSDGDGDVDLTDFGIFQACFNGPNRPYNPPPVDQRKCACMDAGDNPAGPDLDLGDFGAFQRCFNGPNRPPAAGC